MVEGTAVDLWELLSHNKISLHARVNNDGEVFIKLREVDPPRYGTTYYWDEVIKSRYYASMFAAAINDMQHGIINRVRRDMVKDAEYIVANNATNAARNTSTGDDPQDNQESR